MSEFIPSARQEAIFKEIQHGTGHIVAEAVAGSGKTTTMEKALNYVPMGKTVCYIAYNKHIVETMRQRVPKNVRVVTCHSMGLSAISNSFLVRQGQRPVVDGNKLHLILNSLLQTKYVSLNQSQTNDLRPLIKKLIPLYKATLLEVSKENTEFLMDRYNLEDASELGINFITTIIADTLMQCKIQVQTIDFDDMIWYPIIYNLRLQQYDIIFADELQDMNKSQIELALKAVSQNGRFVGVGDRFQSIYGFRGADTEAIPNIIERLKAKVLPLDITYRCPISHVKKAQEFVPNIQAASWAKEGEIKEIASEKLIDAVKPDDMIICRYNAPLIPSAFKLIRAGIKATIRGKDIGEGLLSLIKKLKPESKEDFLQKLKSWKQKESQYAEEQGKNIESIHDKYECLLALSDGCDTVDCIKNRIFTIFNDENAAVILSSIHRAKGLEANRVFILNPELMPSSYATTPIEIQQERNCQYVAYTRAKESLFLVR